MAFLDISSLSKTYGTVNVLENVNLEIEQGEFVVFVGPSGCGKSTLLRMISGLEAISSGEISIAGQVVNDIEPAQRGTAMVFQSYALYPHMTVRDNISFSLRMARKPKAFINERVAKAAAILRLDALLDRKPGQLSGGQKQRVAIGRAIVREPKVFLFDEPLSNLDAELRVQMRTELMDLHSRLGTTMIYVTHDQVEAMTLANKMVVMNGGHIQQAGHPLHLYDDPDNKFVAGFVGSPRINFLPCTIMESSAHTVRLLMGDSTVTIPFQGFDSSATTMVDIAVRPHHLDVLSDDSTVPPDHFVIEGAVTFAEQLGDITYVHLILDDGTKVIIRGNRHNYLGQTRLRACASVANVLLFGPDGNRIRPKSDA
ncbi:ABC transporter ATP-binding protein [Limoniibacter endophyticus]|uniref:Sugar ABC transporter ATP-binding protein n=1 Tax=Limoniibacter endophyticus TaxID=1565040 RepID=A0A8J3GIE7_9HYPH|nr:sn-glycerol-3-phosphate ABC transporter ATP-binding protein UgpC [Limoniibacter endophyticus]GHC78072.1 sugar ABC transporter ATP-binding protein [Limoniibacter endophyticus]